MTSVVVKSKTTPSCFNCTIIITVPELAIIHLSYKNAHGIYNPALLGLESHAFNNFVDYIRRSHTLCKAISKVTCIIMKVDNN